MVPRPLLHGRSWAKKPLFACALLAWGCVAQSGRTQPSGVPVRVVSWNIEDGIDAPEERGYTALVDVLTGLEADVIALNEVRASDVTAGGRLAQLAHDLGMPVVFTAFPQPFGTLGNALLSRLDVRETCSPSAAELSGDAFASDLTRTVLAASLDVPAADRSFAVISTHLKSASDATDEVSFFRRAVDAVRTVGAAACVGDAGLAVIAGDFNFQTGDLGENEVFHRVPDGLPAAYNIGSDISALLYDEALHASPFRTLEIEGWRDLDLRTRGGSAVTRPISGRALDHAWVDGRATGIAVRGEIHVCGLEPQQKPGAVGSSGDGCDQVSDHLPLVVEFFLPEAHAAEGR